MATVEYMLNIFIFVFMLTSRSFGAAPSTAICKAATQDYFRNFPQRFLASRRLLNQVKSQNKELSHEDIKNLFIPACKNAGNEYRKKQCWQNTYCWCSDPNGNLVRGTFLQGEEAAELDCTTLCVEGNNSYKNGEFFKNPNECKSCKCDNGEITSCSYECNNKTNLSFQELKEIKITILKVIFIKYEYRDRPAAPLITEDNLNIVSENLALKYRQQRLSWIFNKRDANQNDKWNKLFDFNPFIKEIHHLKSLRQVNSDEIFTIIDTSGDNLISQAEWLSFFDNIDMTSSTNENGSTMDEESSGNNEQISTRSVASSRNLLEVMKEFLNKLHRQQRMSHSKDKYF